MDEAFYPSRTPAAACRGKVPTRQVNASERIEYLSFKTAQAEAVTVEIINSAEQSVATIVRDLPVERYKPLSLCWNGQLGPTQSGGLAPPGEYRLQRETAQSEPHARLHGQLQTGTAPVTVPWGLIHALTADRRSAAQPLRPQVPHVDDPK